MKLSRTKELAQVLLDTTEGVAPAEQAAALKGFVEYLARKRALGAADAIMAQYQSLYNAKHGIVEATVTLVSRLPDPALRELQEALQRRHAAREVRITQKVDARILGGMKIQVGDEVSDSSLQNSLDQLQAALLK